MPCSTNCATQDHNTFGECLRAKNLRVAYSQSASGRDATTQKKADKALDNYESARREGIQPKSTRPVDVLMARAISDKTGEAFRA